MSDQQARQPFQPFRFRIPWVTYSAPAVPRAPTPPTQPQPAAQPPALVRPPFRPAGVAPPRSSSQPQAPPRTEPQPPSPTRIASLPPSPKVPSQPQAQPRTEPQPPSPTRIASLPPSPKVPSQPQAQPRTEAQPPSPTRIASLPPSPKVPSQPQAQPRTEPQPPSPTRIASLPPSPKVPSPPQAQPKTELKAPSPTRVASLPPSPKVPSQPQAPPKIESHPSSPARGTSQSRVISQPPSPSQSVPPRPQDSPKVEFPNQAATQSQVTSQSYQPQAPEKTESPSLAPTALESRVPSQPQSPSQISQPQPRTQKISQPTSPAITTTKPEQVSQPPSPLRPTSQLAPRASSNPPSPSRLSYQEEYTARKASQPPSPSTKAPPSQPTAQTLPKHSSPSKSSVSRNEPQTDKILQSQPAMSKAEPEYPPKREGLSELASQPQKQTQVQTKYQHDLETKRPFESLVNPTDHGQLSSGMKPEDIKDDRPKEIKEEKSMIPASEEPNKITIPEVLHVASGEEKRSLKNQTLRDDKEMLATADRAKERKTAVPIYQKERKESSEQHPKSSLPRGEHAPLHKEIRDDISKFVHKLSTENSKQSTDENPVSVITLAGENRGASMHLDSNAEKKEGLIHIHRGYKLNQDGSSDATTDGETSSKARRSSDPITKEDPASIVYINSNTQSINNSIIFNSSVSEGSPGVHFVFSNNHKEHVKSNEKTESVQARKSDFNMTQSQRLTYEPTIRRRCLRGLFLEPSESDPDKPRRHGCRYGCNEKQNGKDNGNES